MASSASWPLILAYHHITPAGSSRYAMSVRRFERHLRRLLDAGYTPIALDTAIESGPFGTGDAPERSFTLTFDDGLMNLKTVALPVLKRLGLLRATSAFIPTAFAGAENAWRSEPTLTDRLRRRADPAEKILTWGDLAELASAGVRIESHGHTHAAMNELAYDDALADAEASRAALAEHGFSARYFALPFGWRTEECKRGIRDAGFDAALSVTGGGRDRYEIRRVPIYGTDGFLTERLKTSGSYFSVFDSAKRILGRG